MVGSKILDPPINSTSQRIAANRGRSTSCRHRDNNAPRCSGIEGDALLTYQTPIYVPSYLFTVLNRSAELTQPIKRQKRVPCTQEDLRCDEGDVDIRRCPDAVG